MDRLCNAQHEQRDESIVFCTLPAGHKGNHVAAIGPALSPGATILAIWSAQ